MFNKPFSFEGRIRRMEYGLSLIIYFVCYMLFIGIMSTGDAGTIIGVFIIIPLAWFVWAQGAKRCHDVDKSGWWQIIPFYFLVLLFQDGGPGMNSYGSNPKGIPGADGQFTTFDSETLDGHLRKNT